MNGDMLYKRLANREDLKDINLLIIMRVAIAVLEETNNCVEMENIYDAV